jgi:hypothetical protein
MCLIIAQEIGDTIVEPEVIRSAWDHNPDGAGYMFCDGDTLIVRKPFFKLKELRRAYHADFAQFGGVSPFILHFRWSTHGAKDETNTHPHILASGRVGLVHNGILPFEPPKGSTISDTVFFCRTVLAHRQPDQLVSVKYGKTLEQMIGVGNKLVLLANSGKLSIVNEKVGSWDGLRWYSNLWWTFPAKQDDNLADPFPSIDRDRYVDIYRHSNLRDNRLDCQIKFGVSDDELDEWAQDGGDLELQEWLRLRATSDELRTMQHEMDRAVGKDD